MAEKEVEEESNVVVVNNVPNTEGDLTQTLSQLKAKILELDRELQDAKKNNKKLEKRNRNLKESIQKLIEEKRHIEDLSKIIEEQTLQIEDYQKQFPDFKSSQMALVEIEKTMETLEKDAQGSKFKLSEQSVVSKQIELLTLKNQELKAELDRRTRISDQLRKEHETILKDRNELFYDVKTLKEQVEGMKQRLDRSFTLLSKKRTTKQIDSASVEKIALSSNLRNSSKGILNRKDKSSTRTASISQDKRTSNGRLILNSVGKMLQRDTSKRTRTTNPIKVSTSKIPVATREKIAEPFKAQENSEVIGNPEEAQNPEIGDKIDELPKAKPTLHRMEASGSIQAVIEKRLVTDIRAKLEKSNSNSDGTFNSNLKPCLESPSKELKKSLPHG